MSLMILRAGRIKIVRRKQRDTRPRCATRQKKQFKSTHTLAGEQVRVVLLPFCTFLSDSIRWKMGVRTCRGPSVLLVCYDFSNWAKFRVWSVYVLLNRYLCLVKLSSIIDIHLTVTCACKTDVCCDCGDFY